MARRNSPNINAYENIFFRKGISGEDAELFIQCRSAGLLPVKIKIPCHWQRIPIKYLRF